MNEMTKSPQTLKLPAGTQTRLTHSRRHWSKYIKLYKKDLVRLSFPES